jgi:hypothetical protein
MLNTRGGVSLVMGMVGYHVFARLVFASLYALYSGVTLLTSVGVLMAPAVHRMLHRFHIETEEDQTR